MLQNWLRPLPELPGDLEPEQLGTHLLRYSRELPPLEQARVVLLGIGQPDADAVRQHLYRLSAPFPQLSIADLGNARRTDTGFLIPLIKELIDSKLFPIIIGNAPEQALAQYKAFQELQHLINLVAVDERIAYRPDSHEAERYYLKELLDSPKSRLFHLNFIGCQAHFTPQALFDYLDRRHFDYTRLGQARSKLSELEPAIRDGDLLSFQLAALQYTAAPGQAAPSPNGFSPDEACQICRYAGMSDKLKAFGLYGFRHEFDCRGQTAQLAAQMAWYAISGFFQRAGDFPASTDGLSEYIVDFKGLEYQLTFWKSEKSGRWWMQVPVKTHHSYQRHRLVPCSYNDYLQACQDELPERLLKALERFG
jgi:formiminoglutamase